MTQILNGSIINTLILLINAISDGGHCTHNVISFMVALNQNFGELSIKLLSNVHVVSWQSWFYENKVNLKWQVYFYISIYCILSDAAVWTWSRATNTIKSSKFICIFFYFFFKHVNCWVYKHFVYLIFFFFLVSLIMI